MAKVPHGIEILRKISIAWVECTNVTDDRQTTDGLSMTYIANVNLSSRSLKKLCPPNNKPKFTKKISWYTPPPATSFLANVNSSSRSLCHRPSVCLSSTLVHPTQLGDWNFRQYFYAMWYLGHPWPLYKSFTEIVPGEPLRRGSLNTRGVAEYSDFGPIQRYISETVQDTSEVSINY